MSLPTYSGGGSGSPITQPIYTKPTNQPYLPDADWTKPVAPRDSINETATTTEDQQLQVAAAGAALRVLYGPNSVGAQLADVLVYQSKLILIAVWGEGEIQAIDSLLMDDAALPASVTATHYTGTAGQTVNATLVAAYAASGITYVDALPGIAYSVIQVPEGASEGFPTFVARLRGMKLYDPRTTTVVYSDNPALALADYLSDATYGLAKTVDWSSVTGVANDCDALVGTEKRRIIGLACSEVKGAREWIDTLRTYASCFVVQGNAGARLISDKAGASVFAFTASNIVGKSMRLKKRGIQQIPTAMRIEYTDTTSTPWRTGTAEVLAAGVAAGTTPRRESVVSLPGIQRYSQAYREAVERRNKLALGDLSADFVGFDEALAIEVGDIVTVSHPIGLSSKLARITTVSSSSPGRWQISAAEYDPAMYSNLVQAEPTFADTNLPSPSEPPAILDVTMDEEIFQLENGTYASRWRITWTAAAYPYLAYYRAELWAGSTLIHATSASGAEWATATIQEGVIYTAKVSAVTTIGGVGTVATQSATAMGKQIIPGNVPNATAFEAGGRVYLSWTPAVDIDIWRYEVRYGATTGSWATATLIDRVDALRLTSDLIPTGTWRLYVKALDSVQQYSTTAATYDVTVTSDANSFFVSSYDQTSPTLTNMASYTLDRTGETTHYVSEDGAMAGTKFPAQADTYPNIAATYQASQTCTWLGEATDDFGQVLSGQWTGEATVEALAGTLTSSLGLSDNGSAWVYTASLSIKDTGRFGRLKHETTTTSVLKVTVPMQSVRLEVIPREEIHNGTSSASSPVTVHLDNNFISTKNITITPISPDAVTGIPDNVGFDAPNPSDKAANIVITSAYLVNLSSTDGATWAFVRGRHSLPTTGKWYWEVVINNGGTDSRIMVGVCGRTASLTTAYTDATSMFYLGNNGNRWPGPVAYGASYFDGRIGVAYDADNGTITFYKENVSQGQITGLTGEKFLAVGLLLTDSRVTIRTQEKDLNYAPPSGYSPLPYGFDVNVFSTAGSRVSRDFIAKFQGV